MGLLARAVRIVQAKLNALLDSAQDPGEDLDYAHQQMLDGVSDLQDAIATTRTQVVRLEQRRDRLHDEVEHHNEQAREAMEQDREDLARRALGKKKSKMNIIEELDPQIASLRQQEATLDEKLTEYKSRASEFRTQKETMKARYEAADSMTGVQETLSGLDSEGVGASVEEAEAQVEEMEARAQAFDELQTEGVFDSPLQGDDLDAELDGLTTASEVEDELDTLRENLATEEEPA